MRKILLTSIGLLVCMAAQAQDLAIPRIGLDSLNNLLMSRLKFSNDFIKSGRTAEFAFNIQVDSIGHVQNIIGRTRKNDTLKTDLPDQIVPILNSLKWDPAIPEGYIHFEIKFPDSSKNQPKIFTVKKKKVVFVNAENFGADAPPVRAEIEATFDGGMEAFRDYVRDNFNYPERCQEEGINGAVLLEFVVEIDGKISNVRVLSESPACLEFTTECVRIIQNSPPWIPGKTNGVTIKSYRTIPIQMTTGK